MFRISEWEVFAIVFAFWIILCAAFGQEISGNSQSNSFKTEKYIEAKNKTASGG